VWRRQEEVAHALEPCARDRDGAVVDARDQARAERVPAPRPGDHADLDSRATGSAGCFVRAELAGGRAQQGAQRIRAAHAIGELAAVVRRRQHHDAAERRWRPLRQLRAQQDAPERVRDEVQALRARAATRELLAEVADERVRCLLGRLVASAWTS
jgi:hypothetical protein